MSKSTVLSIIAVLVIVVCTFKIIKDDGAGTRRVEAMPISSTTEVPPTQLPAPAGEFIPDQTQTLPYMTLEECQAAAAEKGWSCTYGGGADGCFLISPDGLQVTKIGESHQ